MTYQLVLQLPSSVVNFDELIVLEDVLSEALSRSATVDGHDFGSGKGNIFIFTGDPTDALRGMLPVLTQFAYQDNATVAYRAIDAEQFTVIWPKDYQYAFSVA